MRNVLPRAIWSYTILIALWLALRMLFADRLWWLALLNTLALGLFVPLPALAIATLWRRPQVPLIGLALPAIAFVALYGELFLPGAGTPAGEPLVTAMTFNVLTSNKNTAAIVAAIRAGRPDIVGMQELTSGKRAALMSELEHEYPTTPSTPRNDSATSAC
jgi:vancomycin resistance protein VanJ